MKNQGNQAKKEAQNSALIKEFQPVNFDTSRNSKQVGNVVEYKSIVDQSSPLITNGQRNCPEKRGGEIDEVKVLKTQNVTANNDAQRNSKSITQNESGIESPNLFHEDNLPMQPRNYKNYSHFKNSKVGSYEESVQDCKKQNLNTTKKVSQLVDQSREISPSINTNQLENQSPIDSGTYDQIVNQISEFVPAFKLSPSKIKAAPSQFSIFDKEDKMTQILDQKKVQLQEGSKITEQSLNLTQKFKCIPITQFGQKELMEQEQRIQAGKPRLNSCPGRSRAKPYLHKRKSPDNSQAQTPENLIDLQVNAKEADQSQGCDQNAAHKEGVKNLRTIASEVASQFDINQRQQLQFQVKIPQIQKSVYRMGTLSDSKETYHSIGSKNLINSNTGSLVGVGDLSQKQRTKSIDTNRTAIGQSNQINIVLRNKKHQVINNAKLMSIASDLRKNILPRQHAQLNDIYTRRINNYLNLVAIHGDSRNPQLLQEIMKSGQLSKDEEQLSNLLDQTKSIQVRLRQQQALGETSRCAIVDKFTQMALNYSGSRQQRQALQQKQFNMDSLNLTTEQVNTTEATDCQYRRNSLMNQSIGHTDRSERHATQNIAIFEQNLKQDSKQVDLRVDNNSKPKSLVSHILHQVTQNTTAWQNEQNELNRSNTRRISENHIQKNKKSLVQKQMPVDPLGAILKKAGLDEQSQQQREKYQNRRIQRQHRMIQNMVKSTGIENKYLNEDMKGSLMNQQCNTAREHTTSQYSRSKSPIATDIDARPKSRNENIVRVDDNLSEILEEQEFSVSKRHLRGNSKSNAKQRTETGTVFTDYENGVNHFTTTLEKLMAEKSSIEFLQPPKSSLQNPIPRDQGGLIMSKKSLMVSRQAVESQKTVKTYEFHLPMHKMKQSNEHQYQNAEQTNSGYRVESNSKPSTKLRRSKQRADQKKGEISSQMFDEGLTDRQDVSMNHFNTQGEDQNTINMQSIASIKKENNPQIQRQQDDFRKSQNYVTVANSLPDKVIKFHFENNGNQLQVHPNDLFYSIDFSQFPNQQLLQIDQSNFANQETESQAPLMSATTLFKEGSKNQSKVLQQQNKSQMYPIDLGVKQLAQSHENLEGQFQFNFNSHNDRSKEQLVLDQELKQYQSSPSQQDLKNTGKLKPDSHRQTDEQQNSANESLKNVRNIELQIQQSSLAQIEKQNFELFNAQNASRSQSCSSKSQTSGDKTQVKNVQVGCMSPTSLGASTPQQTSELQNGNDLYSNNDKFANKVYVLGIDLNSQTFTNTLHNFRGSKQKILSLDSFAFKKKALPIQQFQTNELFDKSKQSYTPRQSASQKQGSLSRRLRKPALQKFRQHLQAKEKTKQFSAKSEQKSAQTQPVQQNRMKTFRANNELYIRLDSQPQIIVNDEDSAKEDFFRNGRKSENSTAPPQRGRLNNQETLLGAILPLNYRTGSPGCKLHNQSKRNEDQNSHLETLSLKNNTKQLQDMQTGDNEFVAIQFNQGQSPLHSARLVDSETNTKQKDFEVRTPVGLYKAVPQLIMVGQFPVYDDRAELASGLSEFSPQIDDRMISERQNSNNSQLNNEESVRHQQRMKQKKNFYPKDKIIKSRLYPQATTFVLQGTVSKTQRQLIINQQVLNICEKPGYSKATHKAKESQKSNPKSADQYIYNSEGEYVEQTGFQTLKQVKIQAKRAKHGVVKNDNLNMDLKPQSPTTTLLSKVKNKGTDSTSRNSPSSTHQKSGVNNSEGVSKNLQDYIWKKEENMRGVLLNIQGDRNANQRLAKTAEGRARNVCKDLISNDTQTSQKRSSVVAYPNQVNYQQTDFLPLSTDSGNNTFCGGMRTKQTEAKMINFDAAFALDINKKRSSTQSQAVRQMYQRFNSNLVATSRRNIKVNQRNMGNLTLRSGVRGDADLNLKPLTTYNGVSSNRNFFEAGMSSQIQSQSKPLNLKLPNHSFNKTVAERNRINENTQFISDLRSQAFFGQNAQKFVKRASRAQNVLKNVNSKEIQDSRVNGKSNKTQVQAVQEIGKNKIFSNCGQDHQNLLLLLQKKNQPILVDKNDGIPAQVKNLYKHMHLQGKVGLGRAVTFLNSYQQDPQFTVDYNDQQIGLVMQQVEQIRQAKIKEEEEEQKKKLQFIEFINRSKQNDTKANNQQLKRDLMLIGTDFGEFWLSNTGKLLDEDSIIDDSKHAYRIQNTTEMGDVSQNSPSPMQIISKKDSNQSLSKSKSPTMIQGIVKDRMKTQTDLDFEMKKAEKSEFIAKKLTSGERMTTKQLIKSSIGSPRVVYADQQRLIDQMLRNDRFLTKHEENKILRKKQPIQSPSPQRGEQRVQDMDLRESLGQASSQLIGPESNFNVTRYFDSFKINGKDDQKQEIIKVEQSVQIEKNQKQSNREEEDIIIVVTPEPTFDECIQGLKQGVSFDQQEDGASPNTPISYNQQYQENFKMEGRLQ